MTPPTEAWAAAHLLKSTREHVAWLEKMKGHDRFHCRMTVACGVLSLGMAGMGVWARSLQIVGCGVAVVLCMVQLYRLSRQNYQRNEKALAESLALLEGWAPDPRRLFTPRDRVSP